MKKLIHQRAEKLSLFIKSRLENITQSELREAMSYAILPGGKRLRPQLCWETASVFGADEQRIIPVAAAIEYIHTYSLIHDDLPSMDDDDTRRGTPSLHRRFGEAVAILAGDAFLTDAFGILADSPIEGKTVKNIVSILSKAAGSSGMVAGQVEDILFNEFDAGEQKLMKIARRKTEELIKASVLSGAFIGSAKKSDIELLSGYGSAVGLAYQISDDIKDVDEDRLNIASCMGDERARAKVEKLLESALRNLEKLGIKEGFLTYFVAVIRQRLEE